MIDDSGRPGREADVAIVCGRIVVVEPRCAWPARRVIHARGIITSNVVAIVQGAVVDDHLARLYMPERRAVAGSEDRPCVSCGRGRADSFRRSRHGRPCS